MSSEVFGKEFILKFESHLNLLESKRKLTLSWSITTIIYCILLFFVIKYFNEFLGYVTFAIIPCIGFGIAWAFWSVQVWRKEFKQAIISFITKAIDPNFILKDRLNFDVGEIKDSFLIPEFDRYDIVNCKLCMVLRNQNNIAISEIKILRKSGRSHKQIFSGFLISASYPVRFTGKTFAYHKRLYRQNNTSELQKVILESPRLMEKFDFWTTNQVEARMCFQTDIMANLLDLCEKYKTEFDLSFIDNRIYIAIHSNKALFEPNIFRTIQNPKIYQEFYDEVTTLNEIITKFKLHQNL